MGREGDRLWFVKIKTNFCKEIVHTKLILCVSDTGGLSIKTKVRILDLKKINIGD